MNTSQFASPPTLACDHPNIGLYLLVQGTHTETGIDPTFPADQFPALIARTFKRGDDEPYRIVRRWECLECGEADVAADARGIQS